MLNAAPSLREWVETTLREKLKDAEVKVEDFGGGDHLQAVVVTPDFEGLNTVKRHRLIYAALGDAMRQAIHALTLKVFTPSEWAAISKNS